jgi:2,4-dienoyl-CoA reductase-like NADH-dependent reductase (Old Yellow Enzyme family)
MVQLFSPFSFGGVEFSNRVIVSPMSQYSAIDGCATDWHFVHYGSLANSGAALVMVESTHVDAQARGTTACLGLYTDRQEEALTRIVEYVHKFGTSLIGVQLNHSGRKASTTLPWDPVKGALPSGWEALSVSNEPFGAGWPVPRSATLNDLARVIEGYVDSTRRALRAGFDTLELHAAHGYLLHSFLSPLTNRRTDQYGGDIKGRMRFPLEVFRAVRAEWPKGKPLSVRVSSTDWDPAGWTIDDSLAFVRRLREAGCDYVCMSSGATKADTKVPIAPRFQTPFASRVKSDTSMPVSALGLISTAEEAQRVILEGHADFVTIGRAFLDNPHWAWLAAARLGVPVNRPRQYQRATPGVWPAAPKPDLAKPADDRVAL